MARKNRGWAMIACVTAVAALGAIAGLATRGKAAANVPHPAVTAAATTVAAVTTAQPQPGPGPDAQLRDCIYGMSKDACEGWLKGEQYYDTECDGGPTPCRTFHLDNGEWVFYAVSSNLICSTTPDSRRGWCDEFRDRTDGRFKARVSLALREQEPCRYRGTIDGEAEYGMNDGSLYKGRFIGLVGAGADRNPACAHTDVASCENCLDVEWVGHSDQPYWRFGVEVIFDGTRVDMPTGETIRLNISGSLTTPGPSSAPDKLYSYKFIGTADGVQKYVCH
jgi:hypothetical protein